MRHAIAASLVLALVACATTPGEPRVPDGAVSNIRTEANGDVITEYRVEGALRMVKVQPARGPAYYVYDRNGDGKVDAGDGGPATYFKLFSW